MKFIRNNLANLITLVRIGLAISLIFFDTFSLPFFIIYSFCGVSDVLDGYIARKIKITSRVGSVLDSLSDWFYLVIVAIKLFPTLQRLLPTPIWVMAFTFTFFHALGYVICFIKFRKFSALHTYANKVMSFIFFCLPFVFIGEISLLYNIYCYVGSIIAIYSGLEVCLIHLSAKEYDVKNKSIFLLRRNQKEDINQEDY